MAKDKITQAKFLVGVMDLQKNLRGILKGAHKSISGGSKPDEAVPQDWMDDYQRAVREATHKICDPEFTHDMAMSSLGARISEILTKGLDEILDRIKERQA